MNSVNMIVWNEFLHDARVLKEAQTLQDAGYRVTVFALHTTGVTEKKQVLPDGIRIIRISRSPLWAWRQRRMARRGMPSGAVPPLGQVSHWKLLLRLMFRFWAHTEFCCKMIWHRADIIHAHDVNVLPTAWLAAKLSGARIVYDAHEISTSREGYN